MPQYCTQYRYIYNAVYCYKINGRDGPSSTKPKQTPCTCCDVLALEVLSYTAPERQHAKSPSVVFQSIPAEQHGIDCSHGMANMFFGILLPTSKAHVVTTKKVPVNVWEATMKNLKVEIPPIDTKAHQRRWMQQQDEVLMRTLYPRQGLS